MTHYAAGRRKEWDARHRLSQSATLVMRSAGSKGLVDLIAIYRETVYLVQVKYVAKGRSWRDANWKKLIALTLPKNVTCVAYVYRRGTSLPEVQWS